MNVHDGVWSGFGLASGLSMFALIDFFRAKISQAKTRRSKLEQANTFLHVHTHSLKEFAQFNEPSLRLKRSLIDFSEQISSEHSASALIFRAGCIGSGNLEPSADAEAVLSDLAMLREDRPSQADTFDQAIRCGLFAALYRWPSAEGAFEKAFAYLVVDQKKQVDRAIRATRTVQPVRETPSLRETPCDNDLVPA